MRLKVCLSLPDLLCVKQSSAELLEPPEVSRDDYLKFVSSLALSIDVDACLRSVSSLDKVAIQVSFIFFCLFVCLWCTLTLFCTQN